MLSEDMKRVVSEQRLGFVATVNADGSPNLSPKGTFVVIADDAIAFGEIRSPQTLRNLKANPAIEVNFVDPFLRKGYRFAGRAGIVERGDASFEQALVPFGHFDLVSAFRAIVTITVATARPITSPAYDRGRSEAELRRSWTRRFRELQPGQRFEE
jgi:predicted pyridoxine 5'-phosphate oxidase superfamily flavin-nucleotide-binding protein